MSVRIAWPGYALCNVRTAGALGRGRLFIIAVGVGARTISFIRRVCRTLLMLLLLMLMLLMLLLCIRRALHRWAGIRMISLLVATEQCSPRTLQLRTSPSRRHRLLQV